MTIEQYSKAQQIIKDTDGINESIKSIERLKGRVEETTGPYQKTILIQLGEGYAYTPQATVSLGNFLDFLDGEKRILEAKKKQLFERFDQI